MMTIPEAATLAEEHHQAGRFAEAEVVCRRILEVQPNHPRALFLVGLIARRVGRDDVAVDMLGRAALADPNRAETQTAFADLLEAGGRADAAASFRRRARVLAGLDAEPSPACRLCGGATRFRLYKTLLGRHVASYHLCSGCGSLQSEEPYWLDEAYAIPTVGLDMGICQRTLQLVIDCCALLALFLCDPQRLHVDFGGGNGLFTRMMRDRGFNFRSHDKYQKPFYSDPFVVSDLAEVRPDVLTAFEVFEHFVQPADEIDRLMARRPGLLVFTTDTYAGQGPDWHYFAPEGGQHIFFYSCEAFEWIARRHDAVFRDLGLLKLFAGKSFIAALAERGVDFEAACAFAADRPEFVRYALARFTEFQANWQERWLETMTPPCPPPGGRPPPTR